MALARPTQIAEAERTAIATAAPRSFPVDAVLIHVLTSAGPEDGNDIESHHRAPHARRSHLIVVGETTWRFTTRQLQ